MLSFMKVEVASSSLSQRVTVASPSRYTMLYQTSLHHTIIFLSNTILYHALFHESGGGLPISLKKVIMASPPHHTILYHTRLRSTII